MVLEKTLENPLDSKEIILALGMRFPGDSVVKNPPADAGDSGDSGLINPREEETTTHSSIPAGKSPWTEEPGGL